MSSTPIQDSQDPASHHIPPDSSPTVTNNDLTRRNFLNTLLLSGAIAPSLLNHTHAAEIAGASGPARTIPADLGTLFDRVQSLASQNDYPLSFLSKDYADVADYRKTVRGKLLDLFHYQPPPITPNAEVIDRWETDDFIQEKIFFNTTPWFRVPAYVLIPKKFTGKRPAIIDLHFHAGSFVFGKEKVMPVRNPHPALVELKAHVSEGRSTSEELVRRGYVVISIDRFYFGERRTIFDDLRLGGMDLQRYSVEDVLAANRRAGRGESTLVKSLFWAGTTWHGIAHWDDIRTVDYLVSRPEVDASRIGCMGISMGSDRTNYLCALDDRIACAASVGWVATLRHLIRSHIDTHSFSHFLPGLTRYLDLPDVLGAFAPKPLLVVQCARDSLYTPESMREAVVKLEKIYAKAGATEAFASSFHDVPHKFTINMQEEVFRWFDKHLTV